MPDAQWTIQNGDQRWLYQRWPDAMIELHLTETADHAAATLHIYDPTGNTPPNATTLDTYRHRLSVGMLPAAVAWLAADRDDTVLWQAMTEHHDASAGRAAAVQAATDHAVAAACAELPDVDPRALAEAIRAALIQATTS